MARPRSIRVMREGGETAVSAAEEGEPPGKMFTEPGSGAQVDDSENKDGGGGSSSGERAVTRNKQLCNGLLLGQVLSALMAATGISAASLDDRGVSLPTFVNLLNYALIALVFFGRMLCKRSSLHLPWWRYALFALVSDRLG